MHIPVENEERKKGIGGRTQIEYEYDTNVYWARPSGGGREGHMSHNETFESQWDSHGETDLDFNILLLDRILF